MPRLHIFPWHCQPKRRTHFHNYHHHLRQPRRQPCWWIPRCSRHGFLKMMQSTLAPRAGVHKKMMFLRGGGMNVVWRVPLCAGCWVFWKLKNEGVTTATLHTYLQYPPLKYLISRDVDFPLAAKAFPWPRKFRYSARDLHRSSRMDCIEHAHEPPYLLHN